MEIIEFDRLKTKVDEGVMEKIREFNDYYEYCFIPEYEGKYSDCETDTIQMNKVHAVTLEIKGRFLLVGIQFFKNTFSIEEVINWLTIYNINYVDNQSLVQNASELLKGVRFKGNVLVLYKKGNKKINFNYIDFPEITEIYNFSRGKVDTSKSKAARKEPLGRLVIHLNDEEMYEVPRLEFSIDKDYIICNGTLIKADYIDSYKNNSIGFYRNDDPINPIASLIDICTEVYIEISEREDGVNFCFIDYKFVIDPYEI